MNEIKSLRHNPISALLAHPFRPFFLITGIYAVAVMLGWITFLFWGMPIPVGWAPVQWHSHEMLYGFVTAATAGFVLTAMTNWTGARPLQGHKLLALLLLWLVGRLAMWFGGWLPDLFVAVLDLAFLPVLGIYVARVLITYNNRRNFILVAVLALLFAGNLLMQIGLITQKMDLLYLGQQHGINVITLLMVIIAGRIIPAFSRNWLKSHGDNPEAVKTFRSLEIFSIGSVALLLVADWFPLPIQVKSVLALLAAVANSLRLVGWVGWKTTREPLLWILHLAYLWVVTALLLRGVAA
ncbi:MAG TPA: NnrS family protein, partial [Cellvibrio sp.]|nr:NnrS family protein [Cellvibrio sp.]